ncbi:unnamed protein product [Amoebophrya sp. A120]|nr:unnamed protein product [Amoebophrya sp. A120]|eukprot:GSA120T00016772001.1
MDTKDLQATSSPDGLMESLPLHRRHEQGAANSAAAGEKSCWLSVILEDKGTTPSRGVQLGGESCEGERETIALQVLKWTSTDPVVDATPSARQISCNSTTSPCRKRTMLNERSSSSTRRLPEACSAGGSCAGTSARGDEFSAVGTLDDMTTQTVDQMSGLGVWECSVDLANYLLDKKLVAASGSCAFVPRRINNYAVLELGCGHALPTMALLHQFESSSRAENRTSPVGCTGGKAPEPSLSTETRSLQQGTSSMECFLHDYDRRTLEEVTKRNLLRNAEALGLFRKSEQGSESCALRPATPKIRFLAGDWSTLSANEILQVVQEGRTAGQERKLFKFEPHGRKAVLEEWGPVRALRAVYGSRESGQKQEAADREEEILQQKSLRDETETSESFDSGFGAHSSEEGEEPDGDAAGSSGVDAAGAIPQQSGEADHQKADGSNEDSAELEGEEGSDSDSQEKSLDSEEQSDSQDDDDSADEDPPLELFFDEQEDPTGHNLKQFDLILCSEGIYKEESFQALFDVLENHLKLDDSTEPASLVGAAPSTTHSSDGQENLPRSVALFSGKRYYFGCGGGTQAFRTFLLQKNKEKEAKKACSGGPWRYEVSVVKKFKDKKSNLREILAVTKRKVS